MIITNITESKDAVIDVYNRLLEFIPEAKGMKIKDRGSMAILADTIGIARSAVTGALKRGSVPESFITYCTQNGISLDYVFGNVRVGGQHKLSASARDYWLFNGQDSTLENAIMISLKLEEAFKQEFGETYSFTSNHAEVLHALEAANVKPTFTNMLYAHRFYLSLLEQGMSQESLRPIMVAHCLSVNTDEADVDSAVKEPQLQIYRSEGEALAS